MFRSSDRGRFLSAHRMAMDAVFIALHVVLSLFSIYILGDQIKLCLLYTSPSPRD